MRVQSAQSRSLDVANFPPPQLFFPNSKSLIPPVLVDTPAKISQRFGDCIGQKPQSGLVLAGSTVSAK